MTMILPSNYYGIIFCINKNYSIQKRPSNFLLNIRLLQPKLTSNYPFIFKINLASFLFKILMKSK